LITDKTIRKYLIKHGTKATIKYLCNVHGYDKLEAARSVNDIANAGKVVI